LEYQVFSRATADIGYEGRKLVVRRVEETLGESLPRIPGQSSIGLRGNGFLEL
jgi:hypothetical protein